MARAGLGEARREPAEGFICQVKRAGGGLAHPLASRWARPGAGCAACIRPCTLSAMALRRGKSTLRCLDARSVVFRLIGVAV